MERSATTTRGSTMTGATAQPTWHPPLNPPTSVEVLDRILGSFALRSDASSEQNRKSKIENRKWTDPALAAAYTACADVIRKHSKSFYFSARFLPEPKRHGIMALYAFCRTSDDLVDTVEETNSDGPGAREAALDAWSLHLRGADHPRAPFPIPHSAFQVARAWNDTRARHAVPQELADELLAGVRMDLTIDRYDTWDDLWLYCYRVASTVGLMSTCITGSRSLAAVPYAVQLGVALQLTNILRDVGEDARAARIYLPREDMERFGYSEEMLLSGTINRSFVALMEFEIERAEALYRSALPGIAYLPPDSRTAVMAAATVYRGILSKIREARYAVFTHRAHLSTAAKVRALPAIWWRCKRLQTPVGGNEQ